MNPGIVKHASGDISVEDGVLRIRDFGKKTFGGANKSPKHIEKKESGVATTTIYGPWDASVPGGLSPGQTQPSFWNIDPQPDNFTYQVTAHSRQRNQTTLLKIAETSLEWKLTGGDLDERQATIHVTLANVGDVVGNECSIMISVVSEP